MELKFRGRQLNGNEWFYGHYNEGSPGYHYITRPEGYVWQIAPETVGQFIGIKDKKGKDIYSTDIVRFRVPVRTTQTHTGDDIPNGSYTEPLEPAIKEYEGEVKFIDGMFLIDGIQNDPTPLIWSIVQWNEEMIREAIAIWKNGKDATIWDSPEEGDLEYLLSECKLKDLAELIEYISGIEVIGNVHEEY